MAGIETAATIDVHAHVRLNSTTGAAGRHGPEFGEDQDGTPWPRTHGWTRGSGQTLWELLDFHAGKGLKHLLCTDIGRDGALTGPNLDLYTEIAQRYPNLQVQASGGVSALSDLKQLSGCSVHSAITGKALLEGRFTVAEAIRALT